MATGGGRRVICRGWGAEPLARLHLSRYVFAMKESLAIELLSLSVAERIQLAADLWDSVAADPARLPPLSEADRAEIERRLAELDADPRIGVEWSEARARILARRGSLERTRISCRHRGTMSGWSPLLTESEWPGRAHDRAPE